MPSTSFQVTGWFQNERDYRSSGGASLSSGSQLSQSDKILQTKGHRCSGNDGALRRRGHAVGRSAAAPQSSVRKVCDPAPTISPSKNVLTGALAWGTFSAHDITSNVTSGRFIPNLCKVLLNEQPAASLKPVCSAACPAAFCPAACQAP